MTLQFVSCDAGGQRYLIDLSQVSSIQQSNVISRLPTHAEPIGELMAHGVSIPLISLAHRLGGVPSNEGHRQYCLIIRQEAARWGLLVDRVHRTCEADPSEIVRLPEEFDCRWCLGAMLMNVASHVSGTKVMSSEPMVPVIIIDPQHLAPESLVADLSSRQSPRKIMGHDFSIRHASQVVEQHGKQESASRQLLLFAATAVDGNQRSRCYGFPAAQITEIVQRPLLTRLPLSREPIIGLAEWRKSIIPVLDLDRAMSEHADVGDPELKNDHRTRLVIARRPSSKEVVGFVASSAVKTLRMTNELASLPCLLGTPAFSFATFDIAGQHVTLPDLDALMRTGWVDSFESRDATTRKVLAVDTCAV